MNALASSSYTNQQMMNTSRSIRLQCSNENARRGGSDSIVFSVLGLSNAYTDRSN
jgi:hypothetical protein